MSFVIIILGFCTAVFCMVGLVAWSLQKDMEGY